MKTSDSRDVLADPEPGFFKTRLVRNGPWVSARIFLTPCQCTVNGGDEEKDHPWQESCDRIIRPKLSAEINGRPANITRVWEFSTDCTKAEFEYLTRVSKWDRENDPDSPYVTPNKAIDLNKTKPIGP